MAEQESMTLAEMLSDIDVHPPNDPRHALANGIREADAEALIAWDILGEDDGIPVHYRQFLALGFVAGAFPPKYCMIPGPDDAASAAEVDAIIAALGTERPLKTSLMDVRHLQADAIRTLVYVGYGVKSDTGTPVIALWHHPKIDLRQAVYFALLAIESDFRRRARSGS